MFAENQELTYFFVLNTHVGVYIHTDMYIHVKIIFVEKVKFSHYHSKLENNAISKTGFENLS